MGKQRPDWIISRIKNTTSPDLVNQVGANFGDYDIKEPGEYWKNPKIQEAFEGNEDTFNKFYTAEKKSLEGNKYIQQDINKSPFGTEAQLNARYQASLVPQAAPLPMVRKVKPDFEGRSFGWEEGGVYSDPTVSWKEVAYDRIKKKDGTWTTPDKFQGQSVWAFNKNGSVALDDEGLPYRREIDMNETLKSYEQIVNASAYKYGLYGLDFGWQETLGTVLNLKDRMISRLIDPFLSIAKTATTEGSKIDQLLNEVINYNRSKDWGMTQDAAQNRYGFESIFNTSADVAAQLVGAKGLGAGFRQAALAATKSPQLAAKWASVGVRGSLTAMASGSVAQVALDNNLSKKEAGAMMLLSGLIFYPIMGLSDAALGNAIARDMSGIRSSIEKILGVSISNSGKLSVGAAGYRLGNVVSGMNKAVTAIPRAGRAATGALNEAMEEGLEQWAETGFQALYDGVYNKYSENPNNNFFGDNFEKFDWAQQWDDTKFAMTAGAIGGGLVGPLINRMENHSPQTLDSFVKVALQGGSQLAGFKKWLKHKHDRGLMGSTELVEGQSETENDKAYQMVLQTVDNIHNSMQKYGLDKTFSFYHDHLEKVFSVDVPKFLQTGQRDLPMYTSLPNDIKNLVQEIETLETKANPSEEDKNALEQKMTQLQEIRSGKHNKKYEEQLALHIAQAAIYRNDERWLADVLKSGEKPLTPVELQQMNTLFQQRYKAHEERVNNKKAALIEESDKATADDEVYTQLTVGKKNDLKEALYQRLAPLLEKIRKDPEAGPDLNGKLDDDTKASPLRDMSMNAFDNYMAKFREEIAIPEEIEFIKNWKQLQKLELVKAQEVPDTPTKMDMYFEPITRKEKSGIELHEDVTDIREQIKLLEKQEQASRTGESPRPLDELIVENEEEQKLEFSKENRIEYLNSSTFEASKEEIEFLERNLRARIAQIGTNMRAKELLEGKIPNEFNELFDEDFNKAAQKEIEKLYGKLMKLKMALDLSLDNPEVLKKRNEFEVKRHIVEILVDPDLQGTAFSEFLSDFQLKDGKNFLTEIEDALKDSGNSDVDNFSTILTEFEDGLHAALNDGTLDLKEIVSELEENSIEGTEAISYFQGVKALAATTVYKAYQSILPDLQLVPSYGQWNAILNTVRQVWSDEELSEGDGMIYTALLDASGGAGKTAVVLPIIGKIVNNLANSTHETERKILLGAAKGRSDKLKQLSDDFNKLVEDKSDRTVADVDIVTLLQKGEASAVEDYNIIIMDEAGLEERDDVDRILNGLQQINSKRDGAPLRIVFSGDTLQMKVRGPEGGIGHSLLDQSHGGRSRNYYVKTSSRLNFSFRATNQALQAVEQAFTELSMAKNPVLPEVRFDPKTGRGVRIMKFREGNNMPAEFISAAKKFLEQAKEKNESMAIITDGPLPIELKEYASLVIDAADIQGSNRDKVVIIPTKHNIRPTSDTYSYDRRFYYTALTRPNEGALILVPDTADFNSFNSVNSPVFNYTPAAAATTLEEETGRVTHVLNGKDIVEMEKTPINRRQTTRTFADIQDDQRKHADELKKIREDAAQEKQTAQQEGKSNKIPVPVRNKLIKYMEALQAQQDGDAERGVSIDTDRTFKEDSFDRALSTKFMYDPASRAGMEVSLTLGVIGKGVFQQDPGAFNFNPAYNGKVALMIRVKEGNNVAVVGSFPSKAKDPTTKEIVYDLDQVFADVKDQIPTNGYAGPLDASQLTFHEPTNPRFGKADLNPDGPVPRQASIPERVRMLRGMSFSNPVIAVKAFDHSDYRKKKQANPKLQNLPETFDAGTTLVAVSQKYKAAELNTILQRGITDVEEEYIHWVPVSPGHSKRFSIQEVENDMTRAIEEAFAESGLQVDTQIRDNNRVNNMNSVLWYGPLVKSSRAFRGEKNKDRSHFKNEADTKGIPVIDALRKVYEKALRDGSSPQLIEKIEEHLPFVLLSQDSAKTKDANTHDTISHRNRRTLLFNAMKAKLLKDKIPNKPGMARFMETLYYSKKSKDGKISEKLLKQFDKFVPEGSKNPKLYAAAYLGIYQNTIPDLYTAVSQEMNKGRENNWIQPDFARGLSTADPRVMWAANYDLGENNPVVESEFYDANVYQNTNLSWTNLVLDHELKFPLMKLNWSSAQMAERVKEMHANFEVSDESEQVETLSSQIEVEQDDEGYKKSELEPGDELLSLLNQYYKGANAIYLSEGLNLFRRQITRHLYKMETGHKGRRIQNVDKAIKTFRSYLAKGGLPEGLKDTVLTRDVTTRTKYHEYVFNEVFDYLLAYTTPSVKFDSKTKTYRNELKHKSHTSPNAKEESALGDNINQIVKSLVYSTPILKKIGEDVYMHEYKTDYSQDADLSTRYLVMNQLPEIVEVLQATEAFKNEDPNLSSRENFKRIMAAGAEQHPFVDSLYRRFFSDKSYTLNNTEYVSFEQVQGEEEAWKIQDALEQYLSSVGHVKFHKVDTRREFNSLPASDKLGSFTTNAFARMGQVRKDMLDTDAPQKGLSAVNYNNFSFQLDGEEIVLGREWGKADERPDGEEDNRSSSEIFEEQRNNVIKFYRAFGMELDNPIVARYESSQKVDGWKDLHKFAKDMVEMIKSGDLVPRTLNQLQALSRAESIVRDSVFQNYVRSMDDQQLYVIRKNIPFHKFHRLIDPRENPALEQNMFNQKWKVKDFFLKLGIRGENDTKISPVQKMLPDEHAEYDMIHGFFNPLTPRSDLPRRLEVAMPFAVYADSKTEVVPVVALPYDPQDSTYNDKVINDLVDSQYSYLRSLSTQIKQRWIPVLEANNIKLSEADSIQKFRSAIKKLGKDADVSALVPQLDYVETKDGFNLKPRLFEQLSVAQGKYDSAKKKLKSQIKSEIKEGVVKLDKLIDSSRGLRAKIMDAAKNAGINEKRAVETFYTTYFAVSNEMGHAMLGPEWQYKQSKESDVSQTEEVMDKFKRAKLNTSPFEQRLFRAPSWETGIEVNKKTGAYTLNLTSMRVNNKDIDPRTKYEGYKLTRKAPVAFMSDPSVLHSLVSGEDVWKEILDGATFVLPLYTYFERASNGGAYGAATTNTMKPVTYSQNNSVQTMIKNAQFTLTSDILRNMPEKTLRTIQAMLKVELANKVRIGKKTYNTAFGILQAMKVNDDWSNITEEHFEKLAEALVVTNNQNSFIHELVPASSTKTGGMNFNEFGATKLTPTVIDQSFKGAQLNATKDPFKDTDTSYASQTASVITLNQSANTIRGLRKSVMAITRLQKMEVDNKKQKDIKGTVVRGMETSELTNSIVSLHQRLRSGSLNSWSINDQAILKYALPIYTSEIFREGISPKFKGMDHIIHPADHLLEIWRHTDGRVALKSELDAKQRKSKDWVKQPAERGLRYSEPTINGVGVVELMKKAGIDRSDPMAVRKWLAGKEMEEGYTEVIVSRGMVRSIIGDAKVAAHQINETWFRDQKIESMIAQRKNDFTKAELLEAKKLEDDNNPMPEEMKYIYDEAVKEGAQKIALYNQRIQGLITRTPGTGKHSASPAKVVAFIEGSNNSIFVPSQLLTIKGADQDIDKESFVYFQIINKRIPFADELPILEQDGSVMPENKELYKAAHKNTILNESIKILKDPKNAFEAHQSVEGVMGRMKAIKPVDQKPRKHHDYTDMVEMKYENNAAKDLISVFANIQKMYLTMKEGHALSGNAYGFKRVSDSIDSVAIEIAGLINAATDAVKERILANLGIDIINGPLVAYWIMQGETLENIVNEKLTDSELKTYFAEIRQSQRYDSDMKRSDIKVPAKFVKALKEAEAITTLASLLPNTKDSAPSTMEDFISLNTRFKTMMSDLNVANNFDLYEYMSSPLADQAAQLTAINKEFDNRVGDLNPLQLIEDVPHMKEYFTLITATHNSMMEEIPIYPYLYKNALNERNFNAVSFRIYQALGERYFVTENVAAHTRETPDGKLTLDTVLNRNIFKEHMHTLHAELLKRYPTNPFLRNLVLVEYQSLASNTDEAIKESKLVVKDDLRSMTEQKLTELRGGFDMLPDDVKADFFHYHLMTNGLLETTESFASLFDVTTLKAKAKWFSFLDSKIVKVFENIEPEELLPMIREAINQKRGDKPSKLILPFELDALNPQKVSATTRAFSNITKMHITDGGNISYDLGNGKKEESVKFRTRLARAIVEVEPNGKRQKASLLNTVKLHGEMYPENPAIGSKENVDRIRELMDSKDPDRGVEILSRIYFGRSPEQLVTNDRLILREIHKGWGNAGQTYTMEMMYMKGAMDKLVELVNKRFSNEGGTETEISCPIP